MGSTKDDKKSKKRKERDEGALDAQDDSPKKKRSREPVVEPALATEDAPEVKKDRKKKRKEPAGDENTPVETPKKKRKRHAAEADEDAVVSREDEPADADDAPKEHKKCRDNSDEDETRKPNKKAKKYPDPAKDETLGEQARKALSYAYSYACKTEWKFNKARQNWLLKHVLDPATVPDAYTKTVFKYFKGIKGQALKHLRQACETLIASPENPADADAATEAAAPSTGTVSEARLSRAAALLKVLPVDEAASEDS